MPIKKGLLLVCGINLRCNRRESPEPLGQWLFPVIGLAALVWYLVRVIPKPSRAEYPCQRVASAPVALGGLSYLLSLFGAVSACRQARKFIRTNRWVLGAVCLVIGLVCAAGGDPTKRVIGGSGDHRHRQRSNRHCAGHLSGPRGVELRSRRLPLERQQGRHPLVGQQQVVQARVDAMLSSALRSLTGATNDAGAWDALVPQFQSASRQRQHRLRAVAAPVHRHQNQPEPLQLRQQQLLCAQWGGRPEQFG